MASRAKSIPLNVVGGKYSAQIGSAKLLAEVTPEGIMRMTNRFYQHAFKDQVLSKFFTDTSEPHGERLGLWLIEKMSGEPVWTDSRPPNSRSRSHSKAWNAPKREPEKKGRRFKLDDCRVWMRLMFRSAREVGLDKNKKFFDWYVNFIGHFVAVYEVSAPQYAIDSAEWSLKSKNIEIYEASGFAMKDVIGVGVRW